MTNQELVRTTPLKGVVAARAGGAIPADAYGQLIEVIRQRCGDQAATLFAEPHPARTESGEPALTWYTSLSGPLIDLPHLDEVAREPVVARLRERLEKLKPLLQDRQLGPMMASWLHIPSPEYVLSLAGDPILICWGYVPQEVALSPSLRAAHFRETLGRYVPDFPTPPFTPQEANEYVAKLAVAEPLTSEGAAADASAATPAALAAQGRARSLRWAPFVAAGAAAAVLGLLLIPGVLVYPSEPDQSEVERQEALLREDNQGLTQRLHELEETARQKVCRLPNGQLSPLPALPGAPANATPAPPRADLLPPGPTQVQVPRDAGAPIAMNELIDRAVVFVVGDGASGTGFFVTPDRIITNRHVIENLDPKTILVTNKQMGRAMPARVVAKSAPPPGNDLTVRDFAVLAIDGAGPATFKLGPSIEKSASVAAAGYPGFLVRGDPGFEQLRRGNQNASPDNTIQYGFVIQKRDDDPVKLVTHSANLGHGNSGGPLLDLCGRVVGVNTAVQNEGQLATTANFAQDVSELRSFLAENGITPESDEARKTCPPAVAQAAPPAAPEQPAPRPSR